MLPALTTKPKQPIKQIKGLSNDSIDSYANAPVSAVSSTTTYVDNSDKTPRRDKVAEVETNNDDDNGTVVLARALRDRKPKSDEELTLKAGDLLQVHSSKKTGYLKCECNGKVGYVPASYVEFLDKDGVAEPSPRKAKKKKSKKKGHKKRHSSEEEDDDEEEEEAETPRKSKKKPKKRDDDDDDDPDDDDTPRKSKKKHRHKHHHSRKKGRSSSESSSDEEATARRRSRRRRHRSRRRHDDDDDDDDSRSSDDASDREARSRRRKHKKEADSDVEPDKKKPESKRASEDEPRDAKAHESSKSHEATKTHEAKGAEKKAESEEVVDETVVKDEKTASSSSNTTGLLTREQQQKKDEVREESSTTSNNSKQNKSTIGKMQDKMRSILGKKDASTSKKSTRSKTQSNGILNACPGTVQGEEGWYEHGECERYYFILVDGKWSLLYGPMTDDDYELFCSKVLEYDLMIELPPTHLHKHGYYLDKDFKVRYIKP
ncbi:hypothetical protein ACHHYP_00331 [Achlya hypogyna]|uniref:SH3 domain-containing protein n=1 Tax=Achlya hypogyna TaxID=1202772 RepID=A0A1V9ZUK2_ACHHY|nr:hypothetical protein ACHHYP_00331 [Achlya hypogyna]